MSHFSVLVVTDGTSIEDLEAALLPYHEYESTGFKQFVIDVDMTDECRNDYAAWSGDPMTFAEFATQEGYELHTTPPRNLPNMYGFVNEKGEVVKLTRRTNPNSKWDWWKIGGRYSNVLITYHGSPRDCAPWSTVDVTATNAARLANREAAKAEAAAMIADGNSPALVGLFYGDVITERPQPAWTFAVLKDGTWHERGQMGWFGIAYNEKPNQDWDAQFATLLKSIRSDQYVWVVDCHI